MQGKVLVDNINTNTFQDLGLYWYNASGSIKNSVKYRMYHNIFEFGGTIRADVTVRNNGNPGFEFYIPNNRELLESFNFISIGNCLSTATIQRNAEVCQVTTIALNKIRIQTTESYYNLPTGMNIWLLPFIKVALKPI